MTISVDRRKTILAAALVVMLSACASAPSIRSDYDKTADFGAYRTYAFIEGAGSDDSQYQSLFTRYMKAAVSAEMDKRGYSLADNPDLLINFNAIFREKTKVTQSAAPVGDYGDRDRFYDPWYGYGDGTQTNISQYTEGTVSIDIVDARRKQLVWEAAAIGRFTEDKPENLEQTIQNRVPEMFARYPFRAAQSEPVVPGE
ncbi:MAG: DUF4136 domain-containing protein [Woeseiaceae bacterium]